MDGWVAGRLRKKVLRFDRGAGVCTPALAPHPVEAWVVHDEWEV